MSIRVVARFIIKEEERELALGICKELADETRKESGCISYVLHESIEQDGLFAFIEEWATSEALEQHLASEHFQRLSPKLDSTMKENLPLEVYRVLL